MSEEKAVVDTELQRYFTEIKEILNNHFGEFDAKVYLYGSRAQKAEHSASDIDLAVQCSDITALEISKAKEAFFESHIPYKIDFINLDTVGQEFRKNILREGILIWES